MRLCAARDILLNSIFVCIISITSKSQHNNDRFVKKKQRKCVPNFQLSSCYEYYYIERIMGSFERIEKLERNCFTWLRIKLLLTRKICKVTTTLCTNLLNTKSHGSRMSLFCARIYGLRSSQITYVGFSTKTRLVAGHVIQDRMDT